MLNILRDMRRGTRRSMQTLRNEWRLARKRRTANHHCAWDEVRESEALFVLSTGRAGTRLLTLLLEQSPALWVEHSPTPELAQESWLVYRDQPDAASLQWSFLHARLDVLTRVHAAGLHYAETNNRISLYAPAIAQLLPRARFLHLVRHPAEFVRSGMRRGYYGRMLPEPSGHIEPRAGDPLRENWGRMDRFEKVAWQWNEINTCIERFKAAVDPARTMTLRSDRLFTDMSACEQVFAFAGIDTPDAAGLRRLQSTVANRQRAGSFPPPGMWSSEQWALLRQWTPLAAGYGFDIDAR